MEIVRAHYTFIYLALAAATILAGLELRLSRAGNLPETPVMPWLEPVGDMDSALARGDVIAAGVARHRAYRAALADRSWRGFLAVGDATLRLGEATGNRPAAEAEARRLYLTALFRARGQGSLDGVLRATEAFRRLGDTDVVEKGMRMARDLAGSDADAQARVRWLGNEPSGPLAVGVGAAGTVQP